MLQVRVRDFKLMKVLTITMAGLGNAIMFGPTLKALREKYPKAEITLLVRLPISAVPFQNSGIVDRIEICPKSSLKMLRLLWRLRRKKLLSRQANHFTLVHTLKG